ncbi:FAD/NAD(P)-binding domain-containing protein [Cylindrobasidium torrendii FP15055 ss-10]|uniref:FAD/NAD(P)-binding domain-containing protein n=1 Tax=Cylindrobasidium torrendii FP15055 ss-10 TaxID=1314674 RepID=A0A0D7ARH0_9AGAR|nr:FAD/NAD(P)-binding domain-containing protein [Cylindrobasidium torrendii FP15055 ss-10]
MPLKPYVLQQEDTPGPIVPKNIPAAEFGVTSDDFFALETEPKHAAVVGRDYIGAEPAGVFNRLGLDAEVGCQDHQARMLSRSRADKTITLDNGETVIADCILGAIGRAPNIEGLNLDKLGVETDSKGDIAVDK